MDSRITKDIFNQLVKLTPLKCLSISLKNCFVYELQQMETWLSYRKAYKEFITIC